MRLTPALRQPRSRFARQFRGLLFCGLGLALPLTARADERQDYRTWNAFLKEQSALKLEPKEVLSQVERCRAALAPELDAHPRSRAARHAS